MQAVPFAAGLFYDSLVLWGYAATAVLDSLGDVYQYDSLGNAQSEINTKMQDYNGNLNVMLVCMYIIHNFNEQYIYDLPI